MSKENQPSLPRIPKKELLELDMDIRLSDLWRQASEVEKWDLETVASYMRAAYGRGYVDAIIEPQEGRLMSEHGYNVPERKNDNTPDN